MSIATGSGTVPAARARKPAAGSEVASLRAALAAAEVAQRDAVGDAAALNKVLGALAGARSTEDAAQRALDSVRESFGWVYGSYWALDPDDRALRFTVESGVATEEFAKVTREASFQEGVGLSGRAWKNRDLFFTPDIGEMTDCVRAPAAQRAGVKSGVCFPVLVNGDVVGTMDFFTTETITPGPQRLDALRNVGRLVSQSIERIRGEEETREAAADSAAVNQVLSALAGAKPTDEAASAALTLIFQSAVGWWALRGCWDAGMPFLQGKILVAETRDVPEGRAPVR